MKNLTQNIVLVLSVLCLAWIKLKYKWELVLGSLVEGKWPPNISNEGFLLRSKSGKVGIW